MPVKWDARTDQILLLKILETSNVSADVKAISDAWPTAEAEKPTPRAITERLGKIRKDVKGGSGSFKVSGQKAAALTSDVTPQKRAPRGSKTGSSPLKKNGGSNITKTKAMNANGKRARNDHEYSPPSSSLPPAPPSLHLPSLSIDQASLYTSAGNHTDTTTPSSPLSLPSPSPTADEDAFNVPASQELRDMLIHYGVIPRDDDNDNDQDDESVNSGDDRSQTMMPTTTGEDAEGSSRKKAKKTKKNTGGEMVKVEAQGEEEGYGFGYGGDDQGQGGEEGGFRFGAFGGDGAGEYPRGGGAVFA